MIYVLNKTKLELSRKLEVNEMGEILISSRNLMLKRNNLNIGFESKMNSKLECLINLYQEV